MVAASSPIRARGSATTRDGPVRGGALGAGGVGEHGDSDAQARGLGDEVRAVQTGAREGGVQVAGADGARVVGDTRDLGGALGAVTPSWSASSAGVAGELRRPGQSRICHGLALLGGLGLISVWHGGERTGRTRSGAK